jgi:hypothetical protein
MRKILKNPVNPVYFFSPWRPALPVVVTLPAIQLT